MLLICSSPVGMHSQSMDTPNAVFRKSLGNNQTRGFLVPPKQLVVLSCSVTCASLAFHCVIRFLLADCQVYVGIMVLTVFILLVWAKICKALDTRSQYSSWIRKNTKYLATDVLCHKSSLRKACASAAVSPAVTLFLNGAALFMCKLCAYNMLFALSCVCHETACYCFNGFYWNLVLEDWYSKIMSY